MAMSELHPLETLYTEERGEEVVLPPPLAALYGPLRLALHPTRPCVVANLVSTLDGVVSLGLPGHTGGAEIGGGSPEDRMVMGLLRALSDVVVVGAGTWRAVPRHVWTAPRIFRPLAEAYQDLRTSLGKGGPPLNVFVSASGNLDLRAPVFVQDEAPVLVVTTPRGAQRLHAQEAFPPVSIAVPPDIPDDAEAVSAASILGILAAHNEHPLPHQPLILLESGPRLLATFWAEGLLDELFLTLAPQVAGRDGIVPRLSLAEGRLFAPDHPVWGTLRAVKRQGSHLFLRYAFGADHTSPQCGAIPR